MEETLVSATGPRGLLELQTRARVVVVASKPAVVMVVRA